MPEKWGKPCRVHAVRCPSCGKRNDFRSVQDAIADDSTQLKVTKTRPTIECDHCHSIMEVVKVEQPILVYVRAYNPSIATAPQTVHVRIKFCLLCNSEYYADEDGTFNVTECDCGGQLVLRDVTREVGDRHRPLQAGAQTITCPNCKQQFYDSVPPDPKTGVPTCYCGHTF